MLLNNLILFADLHKEFFPIVLDFLVVLNVMVESFATDIQISLFLGFADSNPIIG
tara:strand:- start:582 stop:746 length:165 start_codon:yes stop_codon:yes gene_type:complete